MAQISDAVQRSVKQFLNAASKERLIVAAYVYGSEARQEATEWSDIDVAVISPDFADDLFAAQVLLMKLLFSQLSYVLVITSLSSHRTQPL